MRRTTGQLLGPEANRLPLRFDGVSPLYNFPTEGAVAYFREDAPHASLQHRLTSMGGCCKPPFRTS